MIQPIMKDILFFNQKSEPATEADRQVEKDLQDTLAAYRGGLPFTGRNHYLRRKTIC